MQSVVAKINALEREKKLAEAAKLALHSLEKEPNATFYAHIAKRLAAKLEPELQRYVLGRVLLLERTHSSTRKSFRAKETRFPLVTVVVPCYNCEKYLQRTIDSVASQTYENFECILIDDFSVDATGAIIKSFCKVDKRFRYYQHYANGGLASSRNSGIRLAKGEFICFLDSDDLLAPDSLANRAKALSLYLDDAMVAGVFDFSMAVSDEFDGVVEMRDRKYPLEHVDFVSAEGGCPFNANQPMLKRDVLTDAGGFPEKYPQAEDWRLWSKILRAGYVFVPVERIGSAYRQTDESMIRRAPLIHVDKSAITYFRAHRDYAEEQDPQEIRYEELFRAAPLFTKAWSDYFAQAKFCERAFNFFGIELARVEANNEDLDYEAIESRLRNITPDFDLIHCYHPVGDYKEWMRDGYKRYFGTSTLDSSHEESFDRSAADLLGHLFYGIRSKNVVGTAHPSKLPLLRSKDRQIIDIVFFPHKAYHTRSFELLLPPLEALGITYKFVDISVPYRDEGARLPSVDDKFISYNEFVFSRIAPRSIACMNDWDRVVKPIVKLANQCGIPTLGFVEGVQDYNDADTGRKRNPYRTVRHVLLPGRFDKKYFANSDQKLWIAGVQRLEGLTEYRTKRATLDVNRPIKRAVVNVNFSYGVLTDRRDKWVSDIEAACAAAGVQMIISQHPQDDGIFPNASKDGLYDLLGDADVFISRFSGAILESLVIGCPVIYYNGHDEKVDKFHESLGDYMVANSVSELENALETIPRDGGRASGRFLEEHCDLIPGDPRGSSIDKTVAITAEILKGSSPSPTQYDEFKRLLGDSPPARA